MNLSEWSFDDVSCFVSGWFDIALRRGEKLNDRFLRKNGWAIDDADSVDIVIRDCIKAGRLVLSKRGKQRFFRQLDVWSLLDYLGSVCFRRCYTA